MTGAASVAARELAIVNQRGLHARASAKFVKCAEGFNAEITVSLRQEAATVAAEAAAKAAAGQLAAGSSLADAAKELGVQSTGTLTIARNAEALPPELTKAAFSVPAPAAGKLSTGTVRLGNGDAALLAERDSAAHASISVPLLASKR